MNQGINEILIEFVNTMIQTFPKDYLVLLNNNLKKLNIFTRSFKLSNVLKHENKIYAYLSGWSRRVSVSVETGIGLAMSYDDGKTFKRLGNGPVLTSSLSEP